MFSLQAADLELAPASIILLIVLAAIIQDDVTCTTVGLFAFDGQLTLSVAWLACLVGTLLGDLIWFALARCWGPSLLSKRPFSWAIRPEQLERAKSFMEQYGSYSIFLSRFLPGMRTPLQIAIGSLYKDSAQAVLVFTVAAIVYVSLIIGICQALRNSIEELNGFEEYGPVVLLFVAVGILSILWLTKRTIGRFTGNDSD